MKHIEIIAKARQKGIFFIVSPLYLRELAQFSDDSLHVSIMSPLCFFSLF